MYLCITLYNIYSYFLTFNGGLVWWGQWVREVRVHVHERSCLTVCGVHICACAYGSALDKAS